MAPDQSLRRVRYQSVRYFWILIRLIVLASLLAKLVQDRWGHLWGPVGGIGLFLLFVYPLSLGLGPIIARWEGINLTNANTYGNLSLMES
jgi:hypothetical protein